MERTGNRSAALRHAQLALARSSVGRHTRRIADGHRLIAVCYEGIGNRREAREHIVEAERLAELHGTPFQLLRTLSSKAEIFDSADLRRAAGELAGLLGKAGNP